MTDVLLLVALKTDQPDIKRRMDLILAAAEPTHRPHDTRPVVYAKAVDQLVAADYDALLRFFKERDVEGLNIGTVAT